MRERAMISCPRKFFICNQCGKLFWHGTHWLKIVERLKTLEEKGSCGSKRSAAFKLQKPKVDPAS